MVKRRNLHPFPAFDEGLLTKLLDECGVKHLHVQSIWSSLLVQQQQQEQQQDQQQLQQQGQAPITGGPAERNAAALQSASQMDLPPGLPQALLEPLKKNAVALTSRCVQARTSADGSTTKLLIELQDGMNVEAVIMQHDASAGKYAGGTRPGGLRSTLCISSQVGCQMGCTFCATGAMGLRADLLAGEIVEQLVHALRQTPVIRNIVFMGMGEPLNNYEAVRMAIRTMTGRPFGISPTHITVSTVGVVPRMLSLAYDMPGVNLALSLHAPSQALRAQLVPAARAYPLHKLLSAMDAYIEQSGRSVLIEYVMLADVNDSEEQAHELGQLLKDRDVNVNLIPYNPTTVEITYTAPLSEVTTRFQKILREQYNLRTTVRQEMGQDIDGACGQLALRGLGEAGGASGSTVSQQGCSSGIRDIEESLGH
eukprot:TRINITY_DN3620_c0_g1_i2.p1 TRINITY_DN3620_c0_g1~~TRINITY_DN3620_c0_g1_i2.p1  ORF type:complete len:424 (+),score=78.04 TRINITY_DN3620_c0_g1_i2:71-1342(+)